MDKCNKALPKIEADLAAAREALVAKEAAQQPAAAATAAAAGSKQSTPEPGTAGDAAAAAAAPAENGAAAADAAGTAGAAGAAGPSGTGSARLSAKALEECRSRVALQQRALDSVRQDIHKLTKEHTAAVKELDR